MLVKAEAYLSPFLEGNNLILVLNNLAVFNNCITFFIRYAVMLYTDFFSKHNNRPQQYR